MLRRLWRGLHGQGVVRTVVWLQTAIAFGKRDEPIVLDGHAASIADDLPILFYRIDQMHATYDRPSEDSQTGGGEIDDENTFGDRVISAAMELLELNPESAGLLIAADEALVENTAAVTLNERLKEKAELVYGDSLRQVNSGYAPYHKPSFCWDHLLQEDYLSECLAVSGDLLRRSESFTRLARNRHELVIALAAHAQRIERIPRIVVLKPAGQSCGARPEFVSEASEIREPGSRLGWSQSGRFSYDTPEDLIVSVVIPTRDRLDLLAGCVESTMSVNSLNLEILIIDNDSICPETHAWFESAQTRWPNLKVIPGPGEFNWSRLNNIGINSAKGDVIVFLNNDTLALSHDWIKTLAGHALRSGVGVVGPLLLYPSGRVQHAGVTLGFGGVSDHLYLEAPVDLNETPGHVTGPFVNCLTTRSVAAVTGACQVVSRSTLEQVGLFDENYQVAGSDIEYCLRCMDRGLRNLYVPAARLEHLESQTRSRKDPPADTARLRKLVNEQYQDGDPFYNPNLWMQSLYPARSPFPLLDRLSL